MGTQDDSIDENIKNKMLVNKHRNKKKSIGDPNNLDNPFFLNTICRENCCTPPLIKPKIYVDDKIKN
jgi:hypothetical protein